MIEEFLMDVSESTSAEDFKEWKYEIEDWSWDNIINKEKDRG